MSRIYYLLVDGAVRQYDDLLTWARETERLGWEETHRIGLDELPNGLRVSTVMLGFDHNWGGGPPLIFETMTFGPGHGEAEQVQLRCSTIEQAKAQHARVVAAARDGRLADLNRDPEGRLN